jgi:hypothetical protein
MMHLAFFLAAGPFHLLCYCFFVQQRTQAGENEREEVRIGRIRVCAQERILRMPRFDAFENRFLLEDKAQDRFGFTDCSTAEAKGARVPGPHSGQLYQAARKLRQGARRA